MPLYLNPNVFSADSLVNYSITASVAANALTIALKDAAGNDPSTGSPVRVSFRSSTLTSGVVSTVAHTSSLSTVISSGSTAGHVSTFEYPIYVGVLNNAGAMELCWSTTPWAESDLISTTAEGGAGAADSATTIYSTTARSNVASRIIGKLLSTQTTAGTWAAAPTNTGSGAISNVRAYLPPTVQRFTSGTAQTYTLPVAPRKPLYIVVEMVGGGGGGGGSGTTDGTAATAGGNSTFGSSLLTANGGALGSRGGSAIAGGTIPTVNSPAIALVAVAGGMASAALRNGSAPSTQSPFLVGGMGGVSVFGGAGGGSVSTLAAGSDAAVNSGSGGGGGGVSTTPANGFTGTGGGSGAYLKALIQNPNATYTYTVGGGGTGQAAGTSGVAGGAGGAGIIIVTEYYQ